MSTSIQSLEFLVILMAHNNNTLLLDLKTSRNTITHVWWNLFGSCGSGTWHWWIVVRSTQHGQQYQSEIQFSKRIMYHKRFKATAAFSFMVHLSNVSLWREQAVNSATNLLLPDVAYSQINGVIRFYNKRITLNTLNMRWTVFYSTHGFELMQSTRMSMLFITSSQRWSQPSHEKRAMNRWMVLETSSSCSEPDCGTCIIHLSVFTFQATSCPRGVC